MLSVRKEEEIKKQAVLQKKRERDATKRHGKRVRGPREEDRVDKDFPQPSNRGAIPSEANEAHPTSMPESPVLQYGLHPSKIIR
jgi:hypothetical protein